MKNTSKTIDINSKVLIVGAGPAGLEAATALCEKGIDPVIIEKSDKAGGLVNLASLPPNKDALMYVVNSRVDKLKKHGVHIQYNTAFCKDIINKINPSIVIIATGSTPKPINENMFIGDNIYTPDTVLTTECSLGKNIAILGGGLVGCETSEYLADKGYNVTVFEYSDAILTGLADSLKSIMLTNMNNYGIKVYTNAKVISGTLPYLNVEINGVLIEFDSFDSFIVAMGRNSNKPVECNSIPIDVPVYYLGDCERVGMIQNAITTADELIKELCK